MLKSNTAAVHARSVATGSARSCQEGTDVFHEVFRRVSTFDPVERDGLTCPTTMVLLDRAKEHGLVSE